MIITRKILICVAFYLFLFSGVIAAWAADQSICNTDSFINLYDKGSLESCHLKDNYDVSIYSYDVDSITCKEDSVIRFYDDGSLESCTLADNTTIGSLNCRADNEVFFYRDGTLKQCVKSED